MKNVFFIFSFLAWILSSNFLHAAVGTYTFVNKRNFATHIDFKYPGWFPINGVLALDMIPNSQYTMTFNSGTSGSANISPGQGKFQNVQGSLIMGDTPNANSPGVYYIVQ